MVRLETMSMLDKTTTAIATGAVASPAWLPPLADVSQGAAMLLPILGCAWILIQFVAWLTRK